MKQAILVIFFVLGTLALEAQISGKPDFSVFPNPTTEVISVNDNHDQVGFVSVFNVMGRKVKEFTFIKGEQYPVSDLPKGMYMVQIQDRNHRTLTTVKLEKR